jgi:O-antigen/teichoic acid export membrane protein
VRSQAPQGEGPAVRAVARNALWNYAGDLAPLVAAVLCIPSIVQRLGTDRFGVLTLAWMLVGYFGLFDFGLGRALTQLVAERLGAGRRDEVPALVWTGIAALAGLGLVAVVVLWGLAPLLVERVLKVPEALRGETASALVLLAWSVPVVIVSAGLKGVLEGHGRFPVTNAIRIPLGVFSYVGPLVVLIWSDSLVSVVAISLTGRVIACGLQLAFCLRDVSGLRRGFVVNRPDLRALLSFGGWMTVTNLVGPLMTYLDRFLIGTVLSVAEVAYYATPYDMISRVSVLSGGLVNAIFPALAATLVSDRPQAARLFGQGVRFVFVVIFPVTLVVVTLSGELLRLWLGSEFANHGAAVLGLLAVGVFLNCLATVPFALVQGAGRPEWAARLHLVELPLYLGTLWVLTLRFGIIGAAIASVLRFAIDTFMLFFLGGRLVEYPRGVGRRAAQAMGVALLLYAAGGLLVGLPHKAVFLALAAIGYAAGAWKLLLLPEDRAFIVRRLRWATATETPRE